jgi:ribonuclease HII
MIAYLDECARGNLFGDVYAAVCIPNENLPDPPFAVKSWDSKKLSPKKRKILSDWIKQNSIWAIGTATSAEIDEFNILNATMRAFHRALDKITVDFDEIFCDGNRFEPYICKRRATFIPHKCFEKGDDLFQGIGMASIVAKVAHDEYIHNLCDEQPELDEKYNLKKNQGYGTAKHIEGIKKYGYTNMHRRTYKIKSLL